MRYILLSLLFVGCTANVAKNSNTFVREAYDAEKELTIFIDKARGVVCYSYYNGTLSCVKLKN